MRKPCLSWDRFLRRIQTLILLLVIILLLVAGSAARAARIAARREQEQVDEPQGDDTECLMGVVDSVRLQGEEDETSILVTWTTTDIRSPCNGTKALVGISCNNSRVAEIRLRSAGLVGDIPSSLSSCYFLQTLDFSWNSLSGPLPTWLGSLSYLSELSLSHNNLSGQIPYELATLSSLTSLDLTHNQLSGSIPAQLGLLSLQFFNVSDNKLSGRVPATLSNTSTGAPRFNASCFANNPHLYGYPLPFFSSPPAIIYKQAALPVYRIVLIGLLSGLGSLTISCCAVWIWNCIRDRRARAEQAERQRARKRKQEESEEEDFGWKDVLERLGG